MGSICKSNVGNFIPCDNPFPKKPPELSEPSGDGLIPIGVPVRRIVARALAMARLREVGLLPPTKADAAFLTRTKGRVRP